MPADPVPDPTSGPPDPDPVDLSRILAVCDALTGMARGEDGPYPLGEADVPTMVALIYRLVEQLTGLAGIRGHADQRVAGWADGYSRLVLNLLAAIDYPPADPAEAT